MRIILPSFEIIDDIDGDAILERIERAGRVSYKSEYKIRPGSAKSFVAKILRLGHESVIEHEKVSVRIVCDRGVSHQLVRHRICSFTQESTRCNYASERFGSELTFILPLWFRDCYDCDRQVITESGSVNEAFLIWYNVCKNAESAYLSLISRSLTPLQARTVLPNSLKTELVMTANLREWRHIFRLRTSEHAHPQMREIMVPLLGEFKKRIPVIFDDL